MSCINYECVLHRINNNRLFQFLVITVIYKPLPTVLHFTYQRPFKIFLGFIGINLHNKNGLKIYFPLLCFTLIFFSKVSRAARNVLAGRSLPTPALEDCLLKSSTTKIIDKTLKKCSHSFDKLVKY